MKTVLTIAGSDCSGGAGIQADLKTITAHGLYGMSVITALTAQNTQKIYDVMPVSSHWIETQLEAVLTDITPDAVKIGMIGSTTLMRSVINVLMGYSVKNIVLDPVMVATSGKRLLDLDAMDCLKQQLIPIADLITPNIPEAQTLTGICIHTPQQMMDAAREIATFYQGDILIKGGHLKDLADDLLYSKGELVWIKGERIGNKERHGTGCTLSSAIACGLARGLSMKRSVVCAKQYISGALSEDTMIGSGNTPLNHAYRIKEELT